MEGYVLVVGPPGTDLTEAAKRLKVELGAEMKDVEEEIKRDPETEEALDAIKATYTTPINMETITHNLPLPKIRDLWKKAVARCLKELALSEAPLRILASHLIYYCGKRNEFYSVIARDSLFYEPRRETVLGPISVLSLVDDIYDMYMRLPDLYSTDQIESFLRKLERDMNINARRLSQARLSSLTLGWQLRNLLHLLSWRHLEPIMAENLAVELKVSFLVWPVKQLIESIKPWLMNPQTITAYLSHPITDARNERNEFGKWPEFAKEVNRLQETLSRQDITLAMPTGIDELRFRVRKRRYTGHLEARWPPIVENENKLLYFKPDSAKDGDYTTLLRPKCWNFQARNLSLLKSRKYTPALRSEINAFLQILVRQIEAQISSRDFLFIYHTKGLVVYRPYYAREPRPAFSPGVDAEVRLWEDIVQLGEQKFIAFVHFKKDLKFILQAKQDKIWSEFVDTVWGPLYKKYNLDKNTVEDMVKNKGRITEMESILDRASVTSKDRRRLRTEFPARWKQGKIELLRKYLINDVRVKPELLGVWVLDDFDALRANAPHIAGFLRNGTPKGNNWEFEIESLFPDNSIPIER